MRYERACSGTCPATSRNTGQGQSARHAKTPQDVRRESRLRAGELWQEHGLVFASRIGSPLTANNVIRAFRIITKKAGLGEDWVPREMRHTFVSVLSANGVPVESIALLAGHERSATTEAVYRHEIRPALTQGAEVGVDSSASAVKRDPADRPSGVAPTTWKAAAQADRGR